MNANMTEKWDPKPMTMEDIKLQLESMTVFKMQWDEDGNVTCTEGVLPIKFFSFIVKNPDYNPAEFSHEIEDSETPIDLLKEQMKEIRKPGFDFVWNNTLNNVPRNSERWYKNHSKKCKVKVLFGEFKMPCANWPDGRRNYNYKDVWDKIQKVIDEYGEIYKFW